MRILLGSICIIAFLTSCSAAEQGADPKVVSSQNFKLEKIYEGRDVVWGFDFVDENRLLVAHRGGDLYLFNLQSQKKEKLNAPKVYSKGQGGLLDVAYKKIGGEDFVYMTYSHPSKEGKANTALARARLNGNKLEGLTTLFRSNADGSGSIHFGSRLAFDENSIFMSVGDRGERDLAQDIHRHNGTIVRLTLDGKPHPENPFIGKEGLDEIYSYGHRNPQGIGFDPVSKRLYSSEMGPRGGDELNWVQKGRNYGWPLATYGAEYYGPKIGQETKAGTEQPVTYWVPSISPSGLVFYTGDKLKGWKNNLFLGCLSSTQIRMLKLEDNKVVEQTALFGDLKERFRHVRNGPGGYLYFSTDSGKIYRVSSK